MFRPLMIAMLLSTSAGAAYAQSTGGPPIAYVKSGTWKEILLTNPGGTGTIRIHRTGKSIGAIDLKPGGGEITFVEAGLLRTLKFEDSGRTISLSNPRGFGCASTAQADRMDYHPDGGPMLVADACGRLWALASSSADPELIASGPTITNPRWLPDGSGFVYTTGGLGVPVEFWRQSYPVAGEPTALGPMSNLPTVNMAHHSNLAIIADVSGYYLWNVDTGAKTSGCKQARNVVYSLDGSEMAYRTLYSKSGDYILQTNSNCSGGVITLAPKGSYTVELDWRR